ncbi:PP2C family protein-serine/threonine phosphatase [Streptomyces sp. KLOTTS4A1]|uniref:PP2C family protein-serine/threonine phosphatase n=1 Tax=Streptomyces sp. KLOTTS4A1 TaxID=3390996 RepID=UPI0039F467F0
MTGTTVLIVEERVPAPPALLQALEGAGVSTIHRPLDRLRGGPGDAHPPAADALLAPAGCAPGTVRALARLLGRGGQEPVVLVYATGDFEELEAHVRLGHDYVVPPFLPALVGARLAHCSERVALGRSAAEADARAELIRYERELEIGREIQEGFLPDTLPVPDGWEIDVTFRPARQVAGDFYDVFELVHRRRLALVVADVCDKGVGAALFMALIRSLLRHTAENSGLQHLVATAPPSSAQHSGIPVVGATPLLNAVTATNGYLTRNHLAQGYFATMFFSVLDPATGSMVYINGGHNPPLLLGADSARPVPLEPTGPAVGVLPDCSFALGYAQLDPGDTLFVYTDGVPEARCPEGTFLGEHRMMDLLLAPACNGQEVLSRVDSAVRAHTGDGEQHDDVTMLALHRPRADAAAARAVA